ncbi:uncharacterized protein LOC133998018 [Scomber scombrus]|uniref:uncharacterized protein LOC133998018 n=1 Tax=Scomber scombrus TaxID=13677 RepID=UPI002DDB9101|nr:uncharacterized protein LOC133998018 [Scomber scombrus]
MDAFRWIQMVVFVILELQITAVTEDISSVIVKEGDDATLPCKHVIANQDECNNTYWFFSDSGGNTADLVIQGQIQENTIIKSDRLSVIADCSLVVKKVTQKDVGRYICRQHRSGQDAEVVLSTLNMDEREESGHVELFCSVRTHDLCRHTVQWRYEGKNVHEDLRMSKQGCHSDARFPTSNLELKSSYHEVFKCEVTDGFTKEKHLFTFSPQSSGDDTTTAKTEVTIRTTVNKPGTISATSAVWWYIIAAVGLVALLIIVVVVIRWKKTEEEKEKKAQRDEEMRLGSNPAVTQSAPETSQDTVDPEDGVSYASVSYTKKTNSKARVRVEDVGDGEGDAVTYSTVKVSPSSAGASTDPSNIYASINDNSNK